MVKHTIIELTNDDLDIYMSALGDFIKRARSKQIIPTSVFSNIKNNCIELSEYLPQTKTLDKEVVWTSIALLQYAVPLMKGYSLEIAGKLEENFEQIKDYLEVAEGGAIELSLSKIQVELNEQLKDADNEEATLGMRLRGYIPDSIRDVAHQMATQNKNKLPSDMTRPKAYDLIAKYLLMVDKGQADRQVGSEDIEELFADTLSRLQAVKAEGKEKLDKVLKKKSWAEKLEGKSLQW